MADQLQLPPGYEDAKPIQAQAENLQLPPGYEDARPVSAPSPEREALIHPEAANLPKASGSSYEMRPTLPSGERVGKMEADETAKKPTLGGTASGLWEAANTPIVPEGRMEKTANEYATEQERLQHPYRAAAARSVADVGKTARQLLTSPLAVGTVGVGPALEEAGGAVKAGAKLLPLAFGAAGGQQAVQGVESMKKEGVNPENLQQTLEGASQAALGGAGTVEGTHAGEAPLKETVTAPVRAASRILRPVAPVLPYVAGETAAGFPGYIAAKVIAPKEWISRTLEKGTVVGLPEEEANARKLESRAKDLEKKAAATKADVDMHKASSAQGIEVPEQFVKAYAKAQGLADEARMHADIAREAADKAGAVSKENPQPEQPVTVDHTAGLQGDIDRMAPKPKVSAPKVPAPKDINVKGPGEIQRETIEQPLTEMPTNPRVGQETLANRQGRMGRTFALPEAPLDLGAGEVLSPEKAPEVPAAEKKPATIEGGLAPLPPDETIKPRPIKKDVEKVGELVNQGLGNEPVKPGVPLKEQTSKFGKPIRSEIEPEAPKAEETKKGTAEKDNEATSEKLSSDPRKAVLQQAGASPEAIEKILSRGTKTDPTSKVGLSKLAEAFGVDLGQTAIGRAKGDVAAGTHMAPADVLKKIIDAGHSPEEIAKAVDEGKHLPTASGGSQGVAEDLDKKLAEVNKKQTETTAKDNKHMEQAKKELGPDAFPSDYLKRAQELKSNEEQVEAHNKNGGSTFHPTKGNLKGKEAFAVGGESEFKDPKLKMTTEGDKLTPEKLDEFKNRPEVKQALDKHKDASVGSWYDKETGKTTTELVKTPESEEEALSMGKNNGEKAIYDLGKGEEVAVERPRLAKNIAEWKAPPELGAMSAEDVGAKVRTKNPEPAGRRTGGELPEGQEEKRSGADRRAQFREAQSAEDKLFKQARQELGEDAATEQIEKRIGEIKDRPKPSSENTKLSDEELLKKGFTQDDLDNGRHLPAVSGAKGKELPTGDELIKKYGESSGDPAHTTFILKDGRGVANTGTDHDIMLGGKATDKKPPREQFVAQGNIRIRPRMGTIGGREVSMSIPESGINDKQLAYINKMGPQLRSGAVLIEIGKPGGDYRILSHGEATEENLYKALSDLAPIKGDKGEEVKEHDFSKFQTK